MYFCVIELEASQLLGKAETSEFQKYTDSSVNFTLLQFLNNWSREKSVKRQGIDKDTLKDKGVLINKSLRQKRVPHAEEASPRVYLEIIRISRNSIKSLTEGTSD